MGGGVCTHVCEGAQPCVCRCGPECKLDSHFCGYVSCQIDLGLIACCSVCVCTHAYVGLCVHMDMCVWKLCMWVCLCAFMSAYVCAY